MPDRSRHTPLLLLVLALLLSGCDGSAATPPPPNASNSTKQDLRIITLAPALTQMVVDLGRADALVGVTDKDTAAPPGLPVVGNYVDLDHERVLTVRPTHLLQMVSKEGISPGLRDLAAEAGFTVVDWPYPKTLDEVAATLSGGLGGAPGVGEVLGVPEQAAAVRDAFDRFFAGLETVTRRGDRPRVLLAIGTNPLMASGPGTVHDELLHFAGGENAAEGATVTAPTFDREALLAMNPQVVLVLSPGRRNIDAAAMAALLPELEALPIDAVEHGRVVLINDPATLLPSTSLPRIATQMARAVRPELADRVDALLAEYERALKEAGRGAGEPAE